MSTLFQLFCTSKRCSGFQGQSPWSGGQGAKIPEAETLFALGCAIEATDLCVFLYSKMQKKTLRCLCCLAKMTFNKSLFGMIKCPEGTLTPLKYFLGCRKGKGTGAIALPLPPFWCCPC